MYSFSQKLAQSFAKFKKDQAGVAAIIGAVALPALVGTVGLAVDTTRYYRAKQVIIEAADAAALAAASVDIDKAKGETREAIATRFFNANIPAGYTDIVTLKGFTFTDTSAKTGGVSVDYKIDASIRPLIAGVVGVGNLDLTHTGTAVREISSLEVVLTMPINGTMCSTKKRTPRVDGQIQGDILLSLEPDRDCKHFNAMKDGVKEFSDILFKNQTVSRLKIGLVPYNYKVRLNDVNNVPPKLIENEINVGGILDAQAENDFFTNTNDAGELQPITPLTTDRNKINTAIRALSSSPAGAAWSRTNLPTKLSALMLDPTQTQYFSGSATPEEFSNPNVQKIVVMMTDGSNIGCCFTNWEPGNFEKQYVYFHKPDNDQQIAYCELMKKYNIKIYSIIFDVDEKDQGGKEINNIFARCASGTYSEPKVDQTDETADLKCSFKQNCYNVSTSDQLKRVYKDIAQNFYISRTSR